MPCKAVCKWRGPKGGVIGEWLVYWGVVGSRSLSKPRILCLCISSSGIGNHPLPALYLFSGFSGSNSGPSACIANTFPIEPSPQPQKTLFLLPKYWWENKSRNLLPNSWQTVAWGNDKRCSVHYKFAKVKPCALALKWISWADRRSVCL